SGLKRWDKRHAEIPVSDCPGSPRFVEFGNADSGEGVEEQFRYRKDRGPLVVDLEIERICIPTYWIFMQGSLFEGRYERSCRRIESIDAAPDPGPAGASAPVAARTTSAARPDGRALDRSLVEASFGYGKDRDYAVVDELLAAGANPDA